MKREYAVAPLVQRLASPWCSRARGLVVENGRHKLIGRDHVEQVMD
jgi:hypothetical protein